MTALIVEALRRVHNLQADEDYPDVITVYLNNHTLVCGYANGPLGCGLQNDFGDFKEGYESDLPPIATPERQAEWIAGIAKAQKFGIGNACMCGAPLPDWRIACEEHASVGVGK